MSEREHFIACVATRFAQLPRRELCLEAGLTLKEGDMGWTRMGLVVRAVELRLQERERPSTIRS